MRRLMAAVALLGWTCISVTVHAGEAAAKPGASEATIKALLKKKLQQAPIESVTRTPVPGIYEVFTDGQIIYVDESATFIINGNLFNIDKNANLTQESMSKFTAIKFDQLPLNLAFKKVKGKGTRKLAYFADPNCGYCKKFEQDLATIDNVTIYVFLYPVLGPDSMEISKSIWCSKDRIKAWDDQLVRNIAPTAPGTCATPIDKIVEFGKQKRINGTPTMFFADGQRIPGAIPTDQIEQRLTVASQTK